MAPEIGKAHAMVLDNDIAVSMRDGAILPRERFSSRKKQSPKKQKPDPEVPDRALLRFSAPDVRLRFEPDTG